MIVYSSYTFSQALASAMETPNSERLEQLFQGWQKKKEAVYGTPPPSPGGHSRASISRSFDKMVKQIHFNCFSSLTTICTRRCCSAIWTRWREVKSLTPCSHPLPGLVTRSSNRARKETTSTLWTRERSRSSLTTKRWPLVILGGCFSIPCAFFSCPSSSRPTLITH